MAKSKNISWVLLFALVCIHLHIDGNSLGLKNQEPNTLHPDKFRQYASKTTRLETLALIKRIYNSQIGVREKGTNSGPKVEKYLQYVGLAKGQPWCAAFVCWVYGQAGVENPKSGWTPELFPASKVIWDRAESGKSRSDVFGAESLKLKAESPDQAFYSPRHATGNPQHATPSPSTPGTGDVFAIYFPAKNRIAHVGFIDTWTGNWLITVEGNTNESGAREGDGVYRKRRLIRSIYRVARYIN